MWNTSELLAVNKERSVILTCCITEILLQHPALRKISKSLSLLPSLHQHNDVGCRGTRAVNLLLHTRHWKQWEMAEGLSPSAQSYVLMKQTPAKGNSLPLLYRCVQDESFLIKVPACSNGDRQRCLPTRVATIL